LQKNDTIKSNHKVQTGYSKHLRLTRKNSPDLYAPTDDANDTYNDVM